MVDVFISYARSELDLAIVLKERIEAMGLSVFFDVEGLDGGDVFPDVLDRAVKSAGAVVGVWSPHALSRPWVKTECLIGKDRRVLIPVVIEPVAPLDVPAAFYGLQTIDLTADLHDQNSPGHRALARALARTLKRPELARPPSRAPQPPVAPPPPPPRPADIAPPRPRPRPEPAARAPAAARAERSSGALPAAAAWAVAGAVLLAGWRLWFDVAGVYVPWSLTPLIAPLVLGWTMLAQAPLSGVRGPAASARWPVALAALALAVGVDVTDRVSFGGMTGIAVAAALAALWRPDEAAWRLGRLATWLGPAMIAAGSAFQLVVVSERVLYVQIAPFSRDLIAAGIVLTAASSLGMWRPFRAVALAFAALLPGLLLTLTGTAGNLLADASYVWLELGGVALATVPGALLTLAVVRLALGPREFPTPVATLILLASWLMIADSGRVAGPLIDELVAPAAHAVQSVELDFETSRPAAWQPWWALIAGASLATGRLLRRYAWALAPLAFLLVVTVPAIVDRDLPLGWGLSAALLVLAGGWWENHRGWRDRHL